jgi:hypothetical protein
MIAAGPGHGEGDAVHLLQAMTKHGSVYLGEDVVAYLDDPVWSDADDIGVVRGVVDFAHGQSVGNDGFAALVVIGEDVRRVEQWRMAKPAQGTSGLVRAEHSGAEYHLM